MERNKQESPAGGVREQNTQVVDAVSKANSGLTDGGFTRMVHKFNTNPVEKSPTTSSNECRPTEQKIRIPRGIAGKIR